MRSVGLWLLAAGMVVGTGEARAEGPKLDTTADLVAYCDTVGPVGEVRDGQNFCDGFIAGSGLLYLELVAGRQDEADRLRRRRSRRWPRRAKPSSPGRRRIPEHMASKPIDGLWRAMAATYPAPNEPPPERSHIDAQDLDSRRWPPRPCR